MQRSYNTQTIRKIIKVIGIFTESKYVLILHLVILYQEVTGELHTVYRLHSLWTPEDNSKDTQRQRDKNNIKYNLKSI